MKILLNGKDHTLNQPHSLADLVHTLSKNPQHLLTEVNGVIISNDQWKATAINDGLLSSSLFGSLKLNLSDFCEDDASDLSLSVAEGFSDGSRVYLEVVTPVKRDE